MDVKRKLVSFEARQVSTSAAAGLLFSVPTNNADPLRARPHARSILVLPWLFELISYIGAGTSLAPAGAMGWDFTSVKQSPETWKSIKHG